MTVMNEMNLATDQAVAVDAAITSRMSVRAFTQAPVSRDTIEHLLQVASRAPSGTNTQPWNCLLYTSDAADDLLCVDLGGRRLIKKKKHTNTVSIPAITFHH